MAVGEKVRQYHDRATPLPEYDPGYLPLVEVHDLRRVPAPEGSHKYADHAVFEVERPNGEHGFQVVKQFADGISLVVVDVVNGRGWAILHDEMRYPHHRPGTPRNMPLAEAAAQGRIGRWSREIPSGGVAAEDWANSGGERELALKLAAAREAAEEGGVSGIDVDRIQRIWPEQFASVGTNNQSFNLFAVRIGGELGDWDPSQAAPEIEEGNLIVNAFSLDRAVPEMINNGTIWELSTVHALNGLWRLPEFRQYLG